MTIPVPMRLDRLQAALFGVLGAAVAPAACVWAYGEPVWEGLPSDVLALRLLGGPSPVVRQGARGRVIDRVPSADLSVLYAVPGHRVVVQVNEVQHGTDVGAGDSPADVASRLVDAINADSQYSGLSAVLGVAGDFQILPGVQEIWQLAVSFQVQAFLPAPVGAALLTEGAQVATVEAQAFAKGREPRVGAWSLAQQALAALQSPEDVETLRQAGVAVRAKAPVTDLSAVVAGHWETRAVFTFEVEQRAAWTRPVDTIDTLTVFGQFSNPTVLTAQTITASGGAS